MDNIHDKLMAQARAQTRAGFVSRHPGAYLLGEMKMSGTEIGFSTQVHASGAFRDVLSGSRAETTARAFVLKLTKLSQSQLLDGILVGRARNNDVVIRHPSISKVHARVSLTSEQGKAAALGSICDLGSKNGTLVNGHRLSRDETVDLRSGDVLMLGDVVCRVLDAETLHVELLSKARKVVRPKDVVDF